MATFAPYLQRGYHLVMVLPDLHLPHQDDAALDCALKAHALLKPKRTIILGDWLDAGSFASHQPKSFLELRAIDFKRDEIDPCNRILDILQQNTELLVYLEGNHEQRIERVAVNANIRSPINAVHSLISPKNLLSAGRNRFIWIDYAKELNHYKITDDLWAFHGWSHAKNVAEAHLSYLMSVSAIFGHVHRAQSSARRNKVTNKIIKAWTPGCLCKLQPLYATSTPTDWIHGFSLIYVKNDGTAWFDYNVRIENGVCILPGGKEIRA